jgi:hypothetical protein
MFMQERECLLDGTPDGWTHDLHDLVEGPRAVEQR